MAEQARDGLSALQAGLENEAADTRPSSEKLLDCEVCGERTPYRTVQDARRATYGWVEPLICSQRCANLRGLLSPLTPP